MSSTSSDSLPPLTRPQHGGSSLPEEDNGSSDEEFETVVSKRTRQQMQKSKKYYKERQHYHRPWTNHGSGGGGGGGGTTTKPAHQNNHKNIVTASITTTSNGPDKSGHAKDWAKIAATLPPTVKPNTNNSQELSPSPASTSEGKEGYVIPYSSILNGARSVAATGAVANGGEVPPPALVDNHILLHNNNQKNATATASTTTSNGHGTGHAKAWAKIPPTVKPTANSQELSPASTSVGREGYVMPYSSISNGTRSVAGTEAAANGGEVPPPTLVDNHILLHDHNHKDTVIDSTTMSNGHGSGHAKGWAKIPLTVKTTANPSDWPSLDEALKSDVPLVLEKAASVRSSCSSSSYTATGDSHSMDDDFGLRHENDLLTEESIHDKDKGYSSDEKPGTSSTTSLRRSTKPKWVPLELEEPVQPKTENNKQKKKKFTNNNNNYHQNQNAYRNANGNSSHAHMNGNSESSVNHSSRAQAPAVAVAAVVPSQPPRVNSTTNNTSNNRPPFRNTRKNQFHHNRGSNGYHNTPKQLNPNSQEFSPAFISVEMESYVMPYISISSEACSVTGTGAAANGGEVPPPTVVDNHILLQCVQKQIEYYLSEENLEKDFYLRRKMDPDGFIPIALVSSFHRLQRLTQDPDIILQAIQNSEHIELFEGFIRPAVDPYRWPVQDFTTRKIYDADPSLHNPHPHYYTQNQSSGTRTPSSNSRNRNFLSLLNEPIPKPKARRNSM